MSPSFIYLSIYPCVHSFLHPFLPTSHLAVYDSIFREITRSSALGRSKLRCPAGKVWMVSPQFSINQKALGQGTESPSSDKLQGPGGRDGRAPRCYITSKLAGHMTSEIIPFPLLPLTNHFPHSNCIVTLQLETLPQHGPAPSLSSHLNILLLFYNLFLFLKHTKPSLSSQECCTHCPLSPWKVLTSVFHTTAPTHPSDL